MKKFVSYLLIFTMTIIGCTAFAADSTQNAPIVILKFDDYQASTDKSINAFEAVFDILVEENVIGSFGIIGSKCDLASEYVNATRFNTFWKNVNKYINNGIEIWSHGWEHSGSNGTYEFSGKYSKEKASELFGKVLKLVAENANGYTVKTFGAPYNFIDTQCSSMINEDYPQITAVYEAKNKDDSNNINRNFNAVVLDNLYSIDNGLTNSLKSNASGKSHVVLQYHPSEHTEDGGMDGLREIIRYFKEQGSVFMTPSDYARSVRVGNDARLDMRATDDITPKADTQYFTRYTPWLKMLHLTSNAEITAGYHGGEACQQIRCIDISPVDNDLAIFGTDTSGVWITTNGGELWYNTNRNMIPTDISDVMCHPTDKNIMFAYSIGTFTGTGAPGIYRSTDMGKSWTRVYKTYISSSYTDNLFAYDNSGNIYAVAGQGVIRSTDNGATWELLLSATETVNDKDNRVRASSIDVSSDGKTIIACYAQSGFSLNGMNVSTDKGTTWSKLYISGNADWNAYSFAIDNNGRYIAGVYNSSTYGLYISSDKGTSWTAFASASAATDKVRSDKPVARLRVSDNYLYANYNQSDKACRRLLYSELDKALSTTGWNSTFLGDANAGVNTYRGKETMYFSQGIDVCGDIVYICTAGPNKSADGGTSWTRKSSGFSGVLIQNFEMDKDGKLVLSATDGNIIRSIGAYTSSNTPSFSRKRDFGTTVATMTLTDKTNSDRIICWYGNSNTSRSYVGIIVTTDGGYSYENCTFDSNSKTFSSVGFKIKDPKTMDTVVLEYDETDEKTIYASCGTSTDNGVTWTANPYYYLDIDGDRILAWDVYGTNPTHNLMYSADKGTSWEAVGNVPLKDDKDMNAFFDAENENLIWYRRTDDFGKINISTKVQTSLKSKVSYKRFSGLAQNPKNPNHLLLTSKALDDGYCPAIYESYDYGESWHVVPGFFGRRTIDGGITFSTTTNEVFIGSHNGIFVYEYDNFNYWQAIKLRYDGKEKLLTAEKSPYGRITLPAFGDYFTLPDNFRFNGWEYNGKLYGENESVTIE